MTLCIRINARHRQPAPIDELGKLLVAQVRAKRRKQRAAAQVAESRQPDRREAGHE